MADAVESHTGLRLIIDMQAVSLDLAGQTLIYEGQDICEFDALIIKKIAGEYSPATLDRLELLRVAEAKGVRVFSGAENILRLIDRLSCSVSLRNAGIPMPETVVTEDIETACRTVGNYGEAVFKPLYSTKARGMCVIKAADGEAQVRKAITARTRWPIRKWASPGSRSDSSTAAVPPMGSARSGVDEPWDMVGRRG